jgi:hypothetical protein
MAEKQEYEYRVRHSGPDGQEVTAGPTPEPGTAGRIYRQTRDYLRATGGGGEIELQKRAVSPWENVERESIEAKERQDA